MQFQIDSNISATLSRWFDSHKDVDHIVWLTYNIRVDTKLAESVLSKARAKRLTVVCGRLNSRDDRVSHRVLARESDIKTLKASGWGDIRALDGLHAKGVFAWRGKELVSGVMGSFNLSKKAIMGNPGQFESIGVLGREQLRLVEAWFAEQQARLLEIKPEWYDAGTGDSYSLDASTGGKRSFSLSAPHARDSEPTLPELRDSCVEKLKAWRPGSAGEPFQVTLLEKLWSHSSAAAMKLNYDRWLLHLPVGLGKTYIALAYALRAIVERQRKAKVLYLTPNRWVRESVESAVRDLSLPESLIDITHPEGLEGDREVVDKYGVVILDEIQNWRALYYRESEPKPRPTYTFWVERVLERNRSPAAEAEPTTVLALSATPYRFANLEADEAKNWQNYAAPPLLSRLLVYPSTRQRWRREAEQAGGLVEQLVSPLDGWTLDKAAAKGLLAKPEFIPLDKQKLAALKKAMSENGDQFEFGKWPKNLKRAWCAAVASRPSGRGAVDRGLKEVARAIAEKLPADGKGIVFLPIACENERRVIWKELLRQPGLSQNNIFDATSDRSRTPDQILGDLKRFQNVPPPALLLAVNRLTEGVSLPEVNTLFMLRPTRSPLIVMQQLGRGVRLQSGHEKKLMVYDLAQAKQAYDKLKLADDQSVTAHAPSPRGTRTTGKVGSTVPADNPRGHGLKLRFLFNNWTHSVVLSERQIRVEYWPKGDPKEKKDLNYIHRFEDGQLELTSMDKDKAFDVTIAHREGAWKASVHVNSDWTASEADWLDCQVQP